MSISSGHVQWLGEGCTCPPTSRSLQYPLRVWLGLRTMVPWEFLIILNCNSKTLPTYWTPLLFSPVLSTLSSTCSGRQGARPLTPWSPVSLVSVLLASDPSLASRTPCLLLFLVFCVADQLHVKQFLTTFPTPTVVLPFGWPHPSSESRTPTPPSV